MTSDKIVVMIGKDYHVFNERKYKTLLDSGVTFKLIGSVNESLTVKLSPKQKERLAESVINNVVYLANKSPEQLIKNFKDSVLREV